MMLIISPSKREAFLLCKLLVVRLEFTKDFSDYLFHFYYLLDYPELTSFIVITCRTVGWNYEGKKRRKCLSKRDSCSDTFFFVERESQFSRISTIGIRIPTSRYHLLLPFSPCFPFTIHMPERAKKIRETAKKSPITFHPSTRL